jgi:hypothetical protein
MNSDLWCSPSLTSCANFINCDVSPGWKKSRLMAFLIGSERYDVSRVEAIWNLERGVSVMPEE